MAGTADLPNTSAQRLLWILFSDANSRCNTLIEEFADLQDTIVGLASDSVLFFKITSANKTRDTVHGFKRAVASDPLIDGDIMNLSTRDRALLNLWNLLGGLLVGMDSNQERHREGYEQAFRDIESNGGATESLYWYISLRGYLLNQLHTLYTEQLLHAHEKLIQMQENQAGTLPQPILFRRWNSAMYGEFLSEYSRHVNWESREAITRLADQDNDQNGDKGELVGPRVHSFTHNWTHYPSSILKFFDVNLKLNDKATPEKVFGPGKRRRFAAVRSAYFYLEQPVLFPLLYHECAHINFPSAEFHAADHRRFFGARVAAVKSLRLAKFPTELETYENFWTHFTEEIWADALAIALGGRGYFLALALQICGLSGAGEFNHYHIDEETNDTPYPLDELGKKDYRKYEVPYPALEISFFWEARLQIAAKLLTHIESQRNPMDARRSKELVQSFEGLLEGWWRSGGHAFGYEGTSFAHAQYWAYRRELNEWVRDRVWDYLGPLAPRLAQKTEVSHAYRMDPETHFPEPFGGPTEAAHLIHAAFDTYRKKYFNELGPSDVFSNGAPLRLEVIAADVRWSLSRDVIAALRKDRTPSRIRGCTEGYANWMRNDGGIAFRLGLEAIKVRSSLLDACADYFDGVDGPWNRKDPPPFAAKLKKICDKLEFQGLHEDEQRVRSLLRRRQILNAVRMDAAADLLLREIHLLVREVMGGLEQVMTAGANDDPLQEMGIGTISFGVMRPDSLSQYDRVFRDASQTAARVARAVKPEARSAYVRGLRWITTYARFSARKQIRCATEGGFVRRKPGYRASVLRLIGDSHFLCYMSGSTPLERDFHPETKNAPRYLVRPRLTVHAGGERLERYSETGVNGYWGQVCQLKFKYRWQWFDAKRRLDEEIAKSDTDPSKRLQKYSLFLSSAWEDAILITWYDPHQKFTALGPMGVDIGTSDGVVIQSSYCVPSACYNEVEAPSTCCDGNDWLEMFKSWAAGTRLVEEVFRTSGRFDFTVKWKLPGADESGAGNRGAELKACAMGLAAMPPRLWAQITNMATTFDVPELNEGGDIRACTHFAVGARKRSSKDRGTG